jgi:hypothetical protein
MLSNLQRLKMQCADIIKERKEALKLRQEKTIGRSLSQEKEFEKRGRDKDYVTF